MPGIESIFVDRFDAIVWRMACEVYGYGWGGGGSAKESFERVGSGE